MNNPWLNFPASADMVHPLDRASVDLYNSKAKPEYKFLTHLAPEPWIGNLEAPLVVLLANPGATKDDMAGITQKSADLINRLSILNLSHQITEYPHFFFDPRLEGTDGYKWYASRFAELIKETSAKNMSQKVLSCELVPYHSFSWKKPKEMPPTQEYTNKIVNDAVERGAVILIGRGKSIWMENVPKLKGYSRYFQPSSSQSAHVSRNNYKNAFAEILKAVS